MKRFPGRTIDEHTGGLSVGGERLKFGEGQGGRRQVKGLGKVLDDEGIGVPMAAPATTTPSRVTRRKGTSSLRQAHLLTL